MGGRSWFWGLAAGGEAGVARMLEVCRTDVDRTLALTGCRRFDDIGSDIVA